MTRTGRIGPVERERVQSRLDEKLPPCWIRREGERPPRVFDPPALLTAGVLGEVLEGNDFACVALSSRPSTLARRLLGGCLEHGVRTYLHAPTFGSSEDDRKLLGKTKQLLARTGGWLDCDLVIGGRGKSALLVLHAPSAVDIGWMRLSGDVSAAAFQVFLRAFWAAPYEALDGATFKPSLDAPFEVPEAPARFFSASPVAKEAAVAVVDSAVDLEALGVSKTACLFTPATASFALVRAVAQRAERLRFDDDLRLPALAAGEGFLSMVIGQGEMARPLRLELPEPSPATAKALAGLADAARTRFEADATVRGADGDVLLEDASFRTPLAEVPIDAGVVRAKSFAEIESASPTSFPPVDPLARQVRWRWKVLPPARPAKASAAKLVDAWKGFDTWFHSRRKKIEQDLEAVEADRGALEKTFEGFRSFFLGASRTTETLRQSLSAMAKDTPSGAGRLHALEVSDELGRLAGEVARLADGKVQTRRNEQERAERAAHDKRVQEARAALDEELSRKATLEADLAKIRERLSDAEKPADNSSGAKDADAKAAVKKLRADRHQTEQRLSAVQRRIDDREQQANAVFTFQEEPSPLLSKKKSGPLFVPTQAASAPPVPDEDLPAVGELIEVGAERMLAIETWEEVPDGEREANRLHARLVGPAEGK